VQVLNLVHITPASYRIEVGQAISLTLSIQPTFGWSLDALPSSMTLHYDVTASVDDWLISGRKRGEFTAEVRPILALMTFFH
jgi:hypothetical protein